MEYRALTEEEIIVFENNNCWAEDWNRVKVAVEGFFPKFFHRVMFYGDIRLRSNQGIRKTLRNKRRNTPQRHCWQRLPD